jgi:hypothetical protein
MHIFKKILQIFALLAEKTILSLDVLQQINVLMGLESEVLELVANQEKKELGMIHLCSILAALMIGWGLCCFIQMTLHQEIWSLWVWFGFFLMYLNTYQLLYSLGGYNYSIPLENQSDWKPSHWISILFLSVSILSSTSFATYECYLILEHEVLPLYEIIPATIAGHPISFAILWLFSMFVSLLPIRLRYYFIESYRQYYRLQHHYTRSLVQDHWSLTTQQINQLLSRYPSFEGNYQSPYVDPPFNTKKLIMGILNPENKITVSEPSE